MVNIVGTDQQVVKRTTCKNCAAILEYTLSEVKAYHGRDYSGGTDGKEWIDCPRCGKQVILRAW